MLTRDTHARIYQGDLSRSKYDELQGLARQKNMTIQDLILDAIRKYLSDLKSEFSLDIEEVTLNNGGARFYLWAPYKIGDKLDRLMKSRGVYLQELVSKAINGYKKTCL